MRFFLIFILVFTSFSALAIDFKSFDEYKKNNAILANDIERLESIKREKHDLVNDQVLDDTIDQFRLLLINYQRINTFLSLHAFASDAKKNGWKVTAEKTQNLVSLCEGKGKDGPKCMEGLNQFKDFINGSNLKVESKDSIKQFIDSYITETNQLAVFDEVFISRFNKNSEIVNQSIVIKHIPIIKFKITPIKKSKLVLPDVKKTYWGEIIFAASFLFVIGALCLYKTKKKIRSLKFFYQRIFQLAFKSKLKIKLFGDITYSGLGVIGKIETPFLEAIQCLHTFAPEAHVNFKAGENELKIETVFFASRSIVGFIEKEAELLKGKLENLRLAVSACGGEFIYRNNLNIKGEIIETSYIIYLTKT